VLGQLGRLVEGGAGRGQVAQVELVGAEGVAGLELQRPVAGGRGRPVGVAQQLPGRSTSPKRSSRMDTMTRALASSPTLPAALATASASSPRRRAPS
jgi:hypothetical protein